MSSIGWSRTGRHESRLVQVPGMPTLNIGDFPEAYGPI
jgi:hypothetical protein